MTPIPPESEERRLPRKEITGNPYQPETWRRADPPDKQQAETHGKCPDLPQLHADKQERCSNCKQPKNQPYRAPTGLCMHPFHGNERRAAERTPSRTTRPVPENGPSDPSLVPDKPVEERLGWDTSVPWSEATRIQFNAQYLKLCEALAASEARMRELEESNRLQNMMLRTESERIKELEAALWELVEASDKMLDWIGFHNDRGTAPTDDQFVEAVSDLAAAFPPARALLPKEER